MEVNVVSPIALPQWAREVVKANNAKEEQLKLLMVKRIEASDVSKQQNRLLLRDDSVKTVLVPALTMEEREKASLINLSEKKKGTLLKKPHVENEHCILSSDKVLVLNGGSETSRERAGWKAAGRRHGGLNVSVYIEAGWRVELLLTRWDGSGATVLKGPEWGLLRGLSNLREGDVVALWVFRRPDALNFNREKICFILAKTE